MMSIHLHSAVRRWLPICVIGLPLFSQKLVRDSLILDIPVSERSLSASDMLSVTDLRENARPRRVAIDEITRYSLIPVDREILLNTPLTDLVSRSLRFAEEPLPIVLGIRKLDLSTRSHMLFFKQYRLNAMISVSDSGSSRESGVLLYDTRKTRFFIGSSLKTGYEAVLSQWMDALQNDMDAFNPAHAPPYHYRTGAFTEPWMRLAAASDLILTSGGFLIDAQLCFKTPETRRLFWESTGLLRYRHEKTFESIEWGFVNQTLAYRWHPSWLFLIRTHLLFGINRWKNMKIVEHQLQDALIADGSLVQTIRFQPRDQRTVVFGLGLYQDVYYVYASGFCFQAGVTFSVGVRL